MLRGERPRLRPTAPGRASCRSCPGRSGTPSSRQTRMTSSRSIPSSFDSSSGVRWFGIRVPPFSCVTKKPVSALRPSGLERSLGCRRGNSPSRYSKIVIRSHSIIGGRDGRKDLPARLRGARAMPGAVRACAGLEGGVGPALALVHGLRRRRRSNWALVAPSLASGLPGARPRPARARRLLPACRGRPSARPLRRAARATARPAAPVPVVGHSLGGLVALRLAVRRAGAGRGPRPRGAAGISSSTRTAERDV